MRKRKPTRDCFGNRIDRETPCDMPGADYSGPAPKRMAANPRLTKFRALADHAMLGRDFARLRAHEIQECEDLLIALADHTDDDFLFKVNRWKLDIAESRGPRNAIQWGLLSQSVEPKSNRNKRGVQ